MSSAEQPPQARDIVDNALRWIALELEEARASERRYGWSNVGVDCIARRGGLVAVRSVRVS